MTITPMNTGAVANDGTGDKLRDGFIKVNDNFEYLDSIKLESTDIADFETTTELNARDTANRNRANHTGTQTASTISDFDTEVSNNTDVAANTSARHTHSNKTILDNTTASFTTADETKLDGIEAGAEVNTLNDVIAGTNITIDKTDPLNPIINATGGGGGGTGDVVGPTSSTDNALARFDSTTGKLLQDGVITESDNGDIKLVNAIELDITPTTITNAEGVISWNAVDKTIDINQGNDVIQQVGQEQYWRGKNQTGATISQPSVVYANGALGASGIMTIAKYIANGTIPGIYTLGITTENIIDGGDGFITTFGKIRGIDTTGTPYGETWAEGDVLYASPTTTGALTKVKPSLPNITIPIAFVISVHSVNGVIAVRVPTPNPLAEDIGYDNTTSGLAAIDVQSAIDELESEKANDNEVVKLTGNQTIAGIKTFSSFPVTPSSTPTADYQVANKKYVDDNAGGDKKFIILSATAETNAVSGAMVLPLSTIEYNNIPGASLSSNIITLPAGTYKVEGFCHSTGTNAGYTCIYNESVPNAIIYGLSGHTSDSNTNYGGIIFVLNGIFTILGTTDISYRGVAVSARTWYWGTGSNYSGIAKTRRLILEKLS